MDHVIGWERFIQHLDFQAARTDLTDKQLEGLEYMRAYSAYNSKILKRVPKGMLEFYIETFVGVQADLPSPTPTKSQSKRGASK